MLVCLYYLAFVYNVPTCACERMAVSEGHRTLVMARFMEIEFPNGPRSDVPEYARTLLGSSETIVALRLV